MQIFKLKKDKKIPDAVIRQIVKILKAGGVIAFPTETTYGLGCDPRNKKALARIYKIKGRVKGKPFPLVAASIEQVRRVANLGERRPACRQGRSPLRTTHYKLSTKYWPGPLTLILGRVAIRVSSHPMVHQITRAFGFPIIATSANKSGQPECRSGRAVARIFLNQKHAPDVLIDAGSLPHRKPSTIARVQHDGSVEILRQGAIRLKAD